MAVPLYLTGHSLHMTNSYAGPFRKQRRWCTQERGAGNECGKKGYKQEIRFPSLYTVLHTPGPSIRFHSGRKKAVKPSVSWLCTLFDKIRIIV